MAETNSLKLDESAMGPLRLAKTTNEEYIPGMRKQGEGLKISSKSDYGNLKAAIVGNGSCIFIPDPDQPEMFNLLSASASDEFMDFLRKHKGSHMAESLPEHFEKMKAESDALAKAYRDNGVRLIRNETNTMPEELINWQVPVTGDRALSLYGGSAGEVFDNVFLSMWEVGTSRGIEFAHRDALLEIFENDPEALWLSMPHPAKIAEVLAKQKGSANSSPIP